MADAPYCLVTYKICRNPKCRRPFAVIAAPESGCKECRRCRQDGYCSRKCRLEARTKTEARYVPISSADGP